MAWVYILLSTKDRKRYIGSTTNLKRRLKEHNQGLVESTKSRRPLELWAYQRCISIESAAEAEKRYKRSSSSITRAIRKGELKLA